MSEHQPRSDQSGWTFANSFLFAITVVTTIGKQNVSYFMKGKEIGKADPFSYPLRGCYIVTID